MNFLKFHSTESHTFVYKQGLNRTFIQCENRMWRVGPRELLYGIKFDGGSDWFCLNREFISYVINSDHEYLKSLKHYFKYTLLPSEVGFYLSVY
jgi:protein xylosyltransferase